MAIETPSRDSIFCAAIDIASEAERAAYIARACGDNHELQAHVEKLVGAHFRAGSFWETPGLATVRTAEVLPLSERPGTMIGHYKLLQQIGEGGMGVVFMAEQTQPVQRKVALKVIKPGMDSRQVIARFEAERQALAMMDHINIARVLDAGATESGKPYFVMELVNGIPITKYCDDNHLTPRARLELFVPVCQAIQHAHQKGIIHRDIKPSNVMVTLYDGKPVPKVIDFGVAKATEQKLTERTLFTQHGTAVGTLEYMSPEQAEMSALGVDTRSDVYSLGVLLYELLTGSTPLTRKQMKEAAFGEILRIIKEEEPQKPSTRLSESGDALASISAQRQTEPAKLSKLIKGELDWIVMKTLEKDRNRRYETASAFAADVQRYLNDEAVQACPPSAGYRMRKFVRRNKGPVAAGLGLMALLVLGTVGTSIGLVWALQAERKATLAAKAEAEQRQVADTQRDRAAAAEKQAKEEAAIAQSVNDFLRNDLLAEAAPEKNARDKKVTVEDVLGRAAERIGGKFDQEPRIEAAIRLTIGTTFMRLGDFPAAQPHMERALEIGQRALGDEHPDTIHAMNELGALYQRQGQYDKAEPLFVKTVEIGRRIHGEEDIKTLQFMNNLAVIYHAQSQYKKAQPLYERALEGRRRVLGEEHRDTLQSMHNLAVLYQAQGLYAKAEPLCIKALEVGRRALGEEHVDTLRFMNNLAYQYQSLGEYAKAEPLYVKALEVNRHVNGEKHPDTFQAMNDLAELYLALNQYPKAEPLVVEALEGRRLILGEEHPATLGSMQNLGRLYEAQDQYAKADPLYVRALEISRRVLGEEHPDTIVSMSDLAGLYQAQGQYAKAEQLYVKALELSRRVQGEDHPHTLAYMTKLAILSWHANKLDRSVPLLEKALKRYQTTLGPDHPNTLKTMANLGVNYRDAGRLSEGTALVQQAWTMAQKRHGPLPGSLAWIPTALAETYDQAGQFAKSEPFYREALETARKLAGFASLQAAGALSSLGLNLVKQRKYADSDPLLRECLKIREQKEPDDWKTFNTKSLLGGSLLGLKKYAEAEPLLVAGYEGMKQREVEIPPKGKVRLAESIERLVQLYEATGKPEKAADWRKKLSATKPAKPAETKKD